MNENNSKKILLIKSSLNKTINSEVILNSSICKLLSKKHKIIEKTNDKLQEATNRISNIFFLDLRKYRTIPNTTTIRGNKTNIFINILLS